MNKSDKPDTPEDQQNGASVIPFPQSRTRTRHSSADYRNLGLSPMAERLGLTRDRLHGHWCSRCEGIWFGYAAEVECPLCGNRRG